MHLKAKHTQILHSMALDKQTNFYKMATTSGFYEHHKTTFQYSCW